jgi:hypothetical protein
MRIGLILAILAALVGWCMTVQAGLVDIDRLSRDYEPVVVTGGGLGGFWGKPVDDLFVYAYKNGSWVQIPYEIDERDASGSYFNPDNGVLDANDEVAVWAADLGDRVNTAVWKDSTDTAIRYELEVTDGTNSAKKAWAYLYYSTLLNPGTTDYVQYNTPAVKVSASNYTLDFLNSIPTVMDSLRVTVAGGGSNTNFIDRAKTRVKSGIWPFFTYYTEEDLINPTVDHVKDGRVRVIQQSHADILWAGNRTLDAMAFYYKSFVETQSIINTGVFGELIAYIRYSTDHDTTVHGLVHYDDFGPAGNGPLSIDGIGDAVTKQPYGKWIEIDHPVNGCYIVVQDLGMIQSVPDNQKELFYQDGGNDPSTENTGQDGLYGEGGIMIYNPPSTTDTLLTWTFLLPKNQGNVGNIYENYYDNPNGVSGGGQSKTTPNVSITVVPRSYPVTIPPGGGSFNFTGTLKNTTAQRQIVDAWTEFIYPDGHHQLAMGPMHVSLPPNGTLSRSLRQTVPGAMPAGTYLYAGYVGTYPSVVLDQDGFKFDKLASQ